MTNYYDDLVRDFLLDLWFSDPDDYRIRERRQLPDAERIHLLNCDTHLRVGKEPHWECGCISDITRGDEFLMDTVVYCVCGLSVPVQFKLHTNESPNFVSDLMRFEELRDVCPYEESG